MDRETTLFPINGLPDGPLRLGWDDQMREIERSSNLEELIIKHHGAICWLAALVEAGILDRASASALAAQREGVKKKAEDRLQRNMP